MKKVLRKLKFSRRILILSVTLVGLWAFMITAYASELELTNDNVNIRAEASTSSASVGSASIREKYEIVGQDTDSAGNVWYRVKISGDNFGYIRSDMGRVIGEVPGTGATGDAEPIPRQEATISASSVRVRSGPSTNHSEVASIQRGTSVILTGEATDSTGRVWYRLEAAVGDRDVVGFVRSDFITPGDVIDTGDDFTDVGDDEGNIDVSDGSTPDDTASATEQFDFEIRYIQNAVGGYDYFLFDRLKGTQWKIDEFLQLINVAETNEKLYAEQSDRQRTIIIILAVVIIILALVLTVLIFKLRDLHEEADMDIRPIRNRPNGTLREPPVKKGARPPDGRPPANRPVRRSPDGDDAKPSHGDANKPERKGQANGRPRRPVEDSELKATEREDKGVRPERVEAPKREIPAESKEKSAPRKPQNFLTDDDEFEFEFLNIDD